VGDKDGVCGTCQKKFIDCPGHFGYFPLALPIYHIGYFKQVINILQSVCKVPNLKIEMFAVPAEPGPEAQVRQVLAEGRGPPEETGHLQTGRAQCQED